MGGAWVFPGGAVNEGETEAETAVREAEEEASLQARRRHPRAVLALDHAAPGEGPLRHPLLRRAHASRTPSPLATARSAWTCAGSRPADALEAGAPGRAARSCSPRSSTSSSWPSSSSVEELLAHARARRVQPVEPRVLVDGGVAQVLLPGEPGLRRRLALACPDVLRGPARAAARARHRVRVGRRLPLQAPRRGRVAAGRGAPARSAPRSRCSARAGTRSGSSSRRRRGASTSPRSSLAPISLVQSVIAGGLVLLTVVADRLFGLHVTRREWIGVGADRRRPRLPRRDARRRRRQRPQRLRHRHARALRGRRGGAGPGRRRWSGRNGYRQGIPLALSAGLLWGASDVSIKALSDHLGDDGDPGARPPARASSSRRSR